MGSVQYMARPEEEERAAPACDLLVGGAVYADGVAQAAPLPGPTDWATPRWFANGLPSTTYWRRVFCEDEGFGCFGSSVVVFSVAYVWSLHLRINQWCSP